MRCLRLPQCTLISVEPSENSTVYQKAILPSFASQTLWKDRTNRDFNFFQQLFPPSTSYNNQKAPGCARTYLSTGGGLSKGPVLLKGADAVECRHVQLSKLNKDCQNVWFFHLLDPDQFYYYKVSWFRSELVYLTDIMLTLKETQDTGRFVSSAEINVNLSCESSNQSFQG